MRLPIRALMRLFKWSFIALCCVALPALAEQPVPSQPPPASTDAVPSPAASKSSPQPKLLAWDAVAKEYVCKPGEKLARFTFSLTNISDKEVVILKTQTSCGCTVAKLPSQPWVLAPRASGQIQVTIDLSNKFGIVKKGVTVMISNAPPETLSVQATVSIIIPPPPLMSEQDRVRNAQLAKADAQAIFKEGCADCHVARVNVRMSSMGLYMTLCGICHDAGARQASMVPNLHNLKKPVDLAFWKNTIANGVPNSLMPAFAAAKGGPLNEDQVNSLADLLNKTMSPKSPPPSGLPSSNSSASSSLFIPPSRH